MDWLKKIKETFSAVDKKIVVALKKIGLPLLRYSLALIFLWFGLLKPLGMSPAAELVTRTVYWFYPSWFVPFLGFWEMAIGICLLWKPLLRVGIFLLLLQMMGTFLPFLLLPEVVFGSPWYALSLEGEFILKNLVLLSAALVIGSHAREQKLLETKKVRKP